MFNTKEECNRNSVEQIGLLPLPLFKPGNNVLGDDFAVP